MGIIKAILDLYIFFIILDVILSYLPQYRENIWVKRIHKISNFSLAPIRKLLPRDLPFDFSPVIAVLVIKLIQSLL